MDLSDNNMPDNQPPSYLQAVHGVHLSPTQLLTRPEMTQVMIDHQWTNLQNNTANTDQEQLIVPAQEKTNCACNRWPMFVVGVIIKIIIITLYCTIRQYTWDG